MTTFTAIDDMLNILKTHGHTRCTANCNYTTGFFGVGAFIDNAIKSREEYIARDQACGGLGASFIADGMSVDADLKLRNVEQYCSRLRCALASEYGERMSQQVVECLFSKNEKIKVYGTSVYVTDSLGRRVKQVWE